jgi:mRNA interferase MazF
MTSLGQAVNRLETQIVISPDEMNTYIQTVIVAPMTTKSRAYPTRIGCTFDERRAWIVLDQLRTVDRQRLQKPLGVIDRRTQRAVLVALAELFAE